MRRIVPQKLQLARIKDGPLATDSLNGMNGAFGYRKVAIHHRVDRQIILEAEGDKLRVSVCAAQARN